jgi:predicted Zn-dependent peptidase
LLGQLAISRENNEHLMLTAGKSHLVLDHFSSLDEIRRKLDDISPSRIMDVANRVLQPEQLNQLIFKK